MPKPPRLFEFTLTEAEAGEIPGPVGVGGHQSLHRRLLEKLEKGLTVEFDDKELGELIRYMTEYRHGTFQKRLRLAFSRSLQEQLGIKGTLL